MADAGRVIAGTAGGLRLLAPGEGTRPLSDRVKQSLFAALESAMGDGWPAPFLDLFAGSGAAGIEALSRGAPSAVFVERDARAAKVIAENLRRTHLGGATIVQRDALAYLGIGAEGADRYEGFGAVVIDPPYADSAAMAAALERLGDPALGWLRDDALVIAKHFWRDEPPPVVGCLQVDRVKRFGETALTFYRVSPEGGWPDAGVDSAT
jgi:16S rRNA (guanine966-N2)-methyltransferase